MNCPYCKNITVCAICGKGYAEAVRARAAAEKKAALYRRALLLACDGDDDKVAFFVSEADATQNDDTPGVAPCDGSKR